MAKMHFKYASMNSGKSIDLMRTAYNYEENGYSVLIVKPSIDTKAGDKISSRIGLERKVDFLLSKNDSVMRKLSGNLDKVNCIFVDEAQFLTPSQVDEFWIISKVMDIPVICYGLRNNFMTESFDGSRRLLEISDVLEELTTLCGCGQIARYVGRKRNGVFETTGKEVVIDGTDNIEYVPLCGDCYLQKVKRMNFDKIRKDLTTGEDRN